MIGVIIDPEIQRSDVNYSFEVLFQLIKADFVFLTLGESTQTEKVETLFFYGRNFDF